MNPPAGRPTVQLQCAIRGPPSYSKLRPVISIASALVYLVACGDSRDINGWIPEKVEKR